MVYGRYNELVFMGIIMVYKPTYNGGAHPVGWWPIDSEVSLQLQYYRFAMFDSQLQVDI